jgi:predicted metalloprotease
MQWLRSDDHRPYAANKSYPSLPPGVHPPAPSVSLGDPAGPPWTLTPLPRPVRRRRAWPLLLATVTAVLGLVAGFLVGFERTDDHRPFPVGACIATDPHWSAGKEAVRPAGRQVNCTDRFDYKVLGVIPLPKPEVTAAYSDKQLRKRALELADGQCPPASAPALPPRDHRRIAFEIYCVQDSVYTIDKEAREKRGVWCVLRDGGSLLLATLCDQRHDFMIRKILPLSGDAFPGNAELERVRSEGCSETSSDRSFAPTERAWAQGYRRLLCLDRDNLEYEQVIERAVADLRGFWDQELPEISPKPSTVKVSEERHYDPKSPRQCGLPVNNAWYCSEGDYVAWDPRWLRSAFYDKYGDIAVAVVLAHEWGHVIQARLGLFDQDRRERLSDEERKRQPVVMEHQADCYAGVWLRHLYDDHDSVAANGLLPAETDRNKAVHAIVDTADAFTSSAERFDESAHGDALKRVEYLLLGFGGGHQTCRDLLPG